MNGRTPTKAEAAWMSKIASMGCCVCLREGLGATPAAVHHMDGKTKKGAHFLTLPLCFPHHQKKSNSGEWVSRHGDGKRAFEAAYGTEQELLAWCRERING